MRVGIITKYSCKEGDPLHHLPRCLFCPDANTLPCYQRCSSLLLIIRRGGSPLYDRRQGAKLPPTAGTSSYLLSQAFCNKGESRNISILLCYQNKEFHPRNYFGLQPRTGKIQSEVNGVFSTSINDFKASLVKLLSWKRNDSSLKHPTLTLNP